MVLLAIFFLALTRAEWVERFKAPILTQSEGLVKVFADCPEDMRREFQLPMARFAADTIATLYGGLGEKPRRFARPGIVLHVGDVRTNVTKVIVQALTNKEHVVTRLYVPSPGYADLNKLRLEIVKGFFRSVRGEELDDGTAIDRYRSCDPELRIADKRERLERFLAGKKDFDGKTPIPDEEGLKLRRTIIRPGYASPRDVLTFASRLYLYPPYEYFRFFGRYRSLSFAEALKIAKGNISVRLVAAAKADEMIVFGGGRGAQLQSAAMAYETFLRHFAADDLDRDKLAAILDEADTRLNIAYETACREHN